MARSCPTPSHVCVGRISRWSFTPSFVFEKPSISRLICFPPAAAQCQVVGGASQLGPQTWLPPSLLLALPRPDQTGSWGCKPRARLAVLPAPRPEQKHTTFSSWALGTRLAAGHGPLQPPPTLSVLCVVFHNGSSTDNEKEKLSKSSSIENCKDKGPNIHCLVLAPAPL